LLKGRKGISYVLRDNLGREVGRISEGKLDSAAVSGQDLQITLDIALQRYAEQLLANKKGSIVCIEPATGEVLALASAPGYDPAALTIHRNRSAAFAALQQDTLKPFFDRSVMAAYAPGSIFKPVLALIAMQENVLQPNRTIYCDGAYRYRHFSYGCHDHITPYNVSIALQHSCNSYFFQTFRDLVEKEGFNRPARGLTTLNTYLQEFGLDEPLGIDLPHEKGGNVPGPAYYDQLYAGDAWRSTYIMSLGIGQGELQLTTLQMANLAAIIANRGYYITPHLIRGFVNSTMSLPEAYTEQKFVQIDRQYFEPVIEGMSRAVTGGTAVTAYHPRIEICGKTGTSQNPHGKDHSVFFAFAPRENPQIAIAVYVENAGWGGTVAAPMAALMIEKYLHDQIDPNRAWIENRMLEMDLLTKP
ncbi:MAG: penicillin-binding transpeptidase domain-containing protein, partial [Saprospiraceae bacterium]|nr:penicillin-binding transpeptidase domain-containing protein [Saprospiraceae bacterium]